MSKKNLAARDISFCAAAIALHIILELFLTIRIGNDVKIALSALPFLVISFLLGPWHGLVSGLVGTFLSQLLSYGITVTTPLWILPYAVQAMTAGLIFQTLKRKISVRNMAFCVFPAGLAAVIINLIASYVDGVVVFKYMTIEVLLGLIPVRLLVWIGLSVIYTAITYAITRALRKNLLFHPAQQEKDKINHDSVQNSDV